MLGFAWFADSVWRDAGSKPGSRARPDSKRSFQAAFPNGVGNEARRRGPSGTRAQRRMPTSHSEFPLMSLPIRHLPVLQNWDCHVCGSCCKEYLVTITDEERRRIEAPGLGPGRGNRRPAALPKERSVVGAALPPDAARRRQLRLSDRQGALSYPRTLRLCRKAAALPSLSISARAGRRSLARWRALRLSVSGGQQGPGGRGARRDPAAVRCRVGSAGRRGPATR